VPPTNKRGFSEWNGYRYSYAPDHPHANSAGFVREHRLVIERRLGRLLTADEVVHHKNHNRADNSDDNLELMAKRDHDRLHTQIAVVCVECGQPHKARGLCGSCYGKFYRDGRAMPLAASRRSRWSKKAA